MKISYCSLPCKWIEIYLKANKCYCWERNFSGQEIVIILSFNNPFESGNLQEGIGNSRRCCPGCIQQTLSLVSYTVSNLKIAYICIFQYNSFLFCIIYFYLIYSSMNGIKNVILGHLEVSVD